MVTNTCQYSQIFFFLGPKMSNEINMKFYFIDIHDDRLYINNIIGHVDQVHSFLENGSDPFIDSPNRMFLGSNVKLNRMLSTGFHTLELTMCLTKPSLLLFS
jgi:hypothetical protein